MKYKITIEQERKLEAPIDQYTRYDNIYEQIIEADDLDIVPLIRAINGIV